MNVGYTSIKDILHEGTISTVKAAADDQNLAALGEEFANVAVLVPYNADSGRSYPTSKTA